MALINSLKEQIEEMKKKEDRLEKAMAEVMVRTFILKNDLENYHQKRPVKMSVNNDPEKEL